LVGESKVNLDTDETSGDVLDPGFASSTPRSLLLTKEKRVVLKRVRYYRGEGRGFGGEEGTLAALRNIGKSDRRDKR